MLKKISFTICVAITSSLLSLWMYNHLTPELFKSAINKLRMDHETEVLKASVLNNPIFTNGFAGLNRRDGFTNEMGGFVEAAKIANPTVVNISAMRQKSGSTSLNNPFGELFGDKGEDWFGYDEPGNADMGISSGSGVIVSSDGYIVTNNHVIVGSSQVKITLYDKRSFFAAVVGTDPPPPTSHCCASTPTTFPLYGTEIPMNSKWGNGYLRWAIRSTLLLRLPQGL
jgi:S1-C subfamily serine protease